jgi:rubrerythrin
MVEDKDEEALDKKHAEEALDRKAEATVQANIYNCSVRMFKNLVKRESTIKQVICKKCGKTFKTNRNKNLCFRCERKKHNLQ